MNSPSLLSRGLRLPSREACAEWLLANWAKPLVLALWVGGVVALWVGGLRGDAGWFLPLGVALVALAACKGLPWPLALGTLPIYAFRYLAFLVPPFVGGGVSKTKAVILLAGVAVWEALPVLVAVGLGVLLVRKRAAVWVLFLVVAGAFSGLSAWVPLPYGFSVVAPAFRELPELVWAFGVDLTGGLLLGAVFVVGHWLIYPAKGGVLIFTAVGLALIGGASHIGFQKWQGECSGLSRKVVEHDVMAIPGGLPPFVSNFKAMSDRAIYPMILFSAARPDLIICPENLIQANKEMDPEDEASTLQRHITSIGIGIAVPFSQSLFGVRDHKTSRIYFSDLLNNKPRVQWKDMARRAPGVDQPIPWLQKRFSADYIPSIEAPKAQPTMELWKHPEGREDAYRLDDAGGLKRVSRAVICMSGEIRDPQLVRRIARDNQITVAMNPNIGGWLGAFEATGASGQARARLLELGLMGYRVGQTGGTELVVPWLDDLAPSAVAPNKAYLRFRAPLPYQRVDTGYVAFSWRIGFFVLPALGAASLLMWLASLWAPALLPPRVLNAVVPGPGTNQEKS